MCRVNVGFLGNRNTKAGSHLPPLFRVTVLLRGRPLTLLPVLPQREAASTTSSGVRCSPLSVAMEKDVAHRS